MQIAAINDLTDAKTLAHLLKDDSIHGRFEGEVVAGDGFISVNGDKIKILSEKDPLKLPWKELGADIVLECTGLFTDKEKASVHSTTAKKVVVSAPAKDADITIVYGVNHTGYKADQHQIISCASCTTNCLAPVAKVLSDSFGIVRGTMTTIHSFTNDQRILDLPHKDLRRARAAGLSMIPTSTGGAAKAIGLVVPELAGKLDGFAIRVPTTDVSVVDLVIELGRESSKEEINSTLKQASATTLKGVMDFSEEPLVSIDYVGCLASSTVDSLSTMVVQKKLAKVIRMV